MIFIQNECKMKRSLSKIKHMIFIQKCVKISLHDMQNIYK